MAPFEAPGAVSATQPGVIATSAAAQAPPSSSIVLVRATELDARVLEFADALELASGCDVVFVTDERRGPTPPCGRPVVGLSNARCEALGLHCPDAFAWQCGDYGYYVARAACPEATHFWMIEYDVRFSGSAASFFASFASRPDIDFLAADLRPAGWDWYWAITARGRDVLPMRCLFPVTRLSSRAIDTLHAKRIAHGKRWWRRALWPNDEAFVATTLVHGDFECQDLNGCGTRYYGDHTFSFTEPINGDAFEPDSSVTQIFHPVLFGAQYARKIARLADGDGHRPYWRDKWKRVAAKWNSRTDW